jgi:Protein of unknown function (DUF3618)
MADESLDKRITTARADLQGTLDELEDKLNVPKQAKRLTANAKASYEAKPVPWIIGATAVAISVAGIIAWAVLSDD